MTENLLTKETIERLWQGEDRVKAFVYRAAQGVCEVLTDPNNEISFYIPPTGDCKGLGLSFDVPNTENKCTWYVEICKGDVDKRTFRIGMRRKDNDLVVSNFILSKATNDEIVTYLNNEDNLKELQETVLSLSASVDEKMED